MANNDVVVADLKDIEVKIERARLMSPGKFSQNKMRPDCFLRMVYSIFLPHHMQHFNLTMCYSSNL